MTQLIYTATTCNFHFHLTLRKSVTNGQRTADSIVYRVAAQLKIFEALYFMKTDIAALIVFQLVDAFIQKLPNNPSIQKLWAKCVLFHCSEFNCKIYNASKNYWFLLGLAERVIDNNWISSMFEKFHCSNILFVDGAVQFVVKHCTVGKQALNIIARLATSQAETSLQITYSWYLTSLTMPISLPTVHYCYIGREIFSNNNSANQRWIASSFEVIGSSNLQSKSKEMSSKFSCRNQTKMSVDKAELRCQSMTWGPMEPVWLRHWASLL